MGEMLDVLNELKAKSESCKVDSKEPEYRKRVADTTYSTYFYADNENCVMCSNDTKHLVDDNRFKIGNYLYTEKQAQKLSNLRNQCDPVTALIIEVTADDNWTPVWSNSSQRKYYALYNHDVEKWICCDNSVARAVGVCYFSMKSKRKVLEALNKHFPDGYPK